MARNLFGGSAADVAEDIDGSRVPGVTGTVWDGPGDSALQLTDLQDFSGLPIQDLTSNDQGMVGHFYGPDNVDLLYVDFGAGRVALTPVNTSSTLSQHLNAADPHGTKADVLEEINAQKGAASGIATLDTSGKVPSSQLPALSGDGSDGTHWLNVKNNPYGAKGNGVTDDTAAILAAIDDAVYGDVVYLPPGVYVISQPLDLYKRGVALMGSHSNLMVGPGMVGAEWACYLQAAPTFTTGAMINIIGEDDGDHPAINGEQRITNLMLDGSKVPTGSLDGVYAKGNVQNVVLRDVCLRQMPNNGIVTAANATGEWPYSWRLHSVMVDNCHVNGMVFERNTDLTLEDCQVIGCWSTGIKLTNCANTIVTHSRAEWCGNYGFHLTGGWGNWPGSGSMTMTGCSTDRNGWDGVRVDASGNGAFLIQGLMTRRDGRNGGPGGGRYAGLRLSGTAPVVVTGLSCYVGTDDGGTAGTSPDYGVHISGAKDVSLDSAYLHGLLGGVYDDGTSTRVRVGDSVTSTAGNNYSEDRKPRSSKGIYIPEGWGAAWRAARTEALTGGKARVVVVGDSITHGFYASNLFTKSWVGIVRNSLQSQFGDGGLGYFTSMNSRIAGHNDAISTAWEAAGCFVTSTGTWTADTSSAMGPGIYSVDSTVVGSSLTFPARGSAISIYTITGGTRSGYTYSIDGGAPVAVADSGGGTAAIQVTAVTGLSTGTHQVTITHNGAAGQKLSVCGVGAENASGVVVSNMARSGSRSAGYALNSEASLNAVWNGGSQYSGDLVVYALGVNDASANSSGDSWAANVAKYLKAVRDVGDGSTDVLIVMQHVGTHEGANAKYQDYVERARGLADTYGAALVDMWSIGRNSWNYWNQLGYWADPNVPGAAGQDVVHLSDAGQAAIADQVLPLLIS